MGPFANLALLSSVLLGCPAPEPEEQVAPRLPSLPATGVSAGAGAAAGAPAGARTTRVRAGRIYVPVYSHIYVEEGGPADLATTLSIRNVSTERSLLLTSVRYYDTSGALIEDYLDKEVGVGPLETVEYFVREADRRGGSGANFIVDWRAESPLVRPLVEAVMVRDRAGNHAYAFSTRGIEIPETSSLPAQPHADADAPAPGDDAAPPAPALSTANPASDR